MLVRRIDYDVPEEYAGRKIYNFLKDCQYSESALKRLRHDEGSIIYNDETVHMNRVLEETGKLSVLINENENSQNILPVALPFDVIYEDEDILVVNKPANMPSHPSLNNFDNTLANAAALYFENKKEPFVFRIINRLDKDTSGLVIIARHFLSCSILSDDLKNRRIKRTYTAIVEGEDISDSGTIACPIGRKDASLIERCVDYENGQQAITHYKVMERRNGLSVVSLNLETGRTHQIRVHMSALGYPLAGDYIYNPSSRLLPRQALHAGELEFTHPITKERLKFIVPMPEDMQSILS